MSIIRVFCSLLCLVVPLLITGQTKENIKQHTEYLASDALGGRGAGSKEIRLAATYISEQFTGIGLEPYSGQSFYQHVPIPGKTLNEKNVIGIIRGRGQSSKSIVFTAHYDAYGIRKEIGQQDSIYNGAQDNAVGVAALIEIARLFKQAEPPVYNLVFLATAAEEFGMYGSKYYVDHPVFPSDEIIICLNIDGFNVRGPREDYFIFPRQGVNFIESIKQLLRPMGWYYLPPDWVDEMNTNFDTASFLSKGIPALTLWVGGRLKGGQPANTVNLGGIHTPQDEVSELWNWEGVEDHLMLYKTIADFFLIHPENIRVTDKELFKPQ